MSDDPVMDTNFVVVDPTTRHNSNVDIEGYSLLPDIIWTPGPEMLNSQYGQIIFTNVKDSYPTNEDLLCTYTIMTGVEVKEDDRVAIFCVGWTNLKEVITWVFAAKHPWPNEDISVVFPACQLPTPSTHFYQFCYLSKGEIRGASIPFNFINKPNVNAEEEQKTLYFRDYSLIGTPAQINIATGDACLHTVAAGHPQNLTISSSDRNNMIQPGCSSNEPLRTDSEESDTSCSEVTSSEQYAPNTQNETQKNMSGISSINVSNDHDTPAVASILHPMQTEVAVPPYLCIPSGCVDSENAILRARLNCEVERNQILSANLQRSEAEVERQMHQYDMCCQNNQVVVRELENELDNQRMRIGELQNAVILKDMTLEKYIEKYGALNENDNGSGGPPKHPPNPGHTDGQLEQEGHVGIGASSGMERQNNQTSTACSYYNALRKTRNYYVTFLSDKSEIEKRVFALSCTKLSLVKKLHAMKERKELLMRLEYRYYTALQGMHGAQNDESRRILEAISEATAAQRALDGEAFMEVDMIDEIKKRLEINRQNTCILRAKAIEVFSKYLETYNYDMDPYNEAAQAEVAHMHSLYAGLDRRFIAILCSIANSVNNTYIWD